MSDIILSPKRAPMPQEQSGASRAIRAVVWAKAKAILPPLAGLRCVDCGSPATVYEHRDYGRPLEVEPVCNPCNSKRGKAIPAENNDPIVPYEKTGTGYVLSKFGIAPIEFDAIDFYPIKRRN